VAALAAVIVWFASHSYLVPLIAGAAILGFGQLASHQYRDKAWAFSPASGRTAGGRCTRSRRSSP
jgi:hypothetical protein